MEENKIIIAIDGYSSCGKSTLAKELAKELSYIYIDTGAMYRAVTFFFMKKNLLHNGKLNTENLDQHLSNITVHFERQADGSLHTFLNQEDVEKEIRTMEVSNLVSEVSKHAKIRAQLVALQQKMSEKKAVILDGRDIGTVVFPNAEVKLFLTADPQIRAQRRFDEIQAKGDEINFEDVLKNINDRDYQDENRTESPLRRAEDAIIIDNSHLNREEQLEEALNIIKLKL